MIQYKTLTNQLGMTMKNKLLIFTCLFLTLSALSTPPSPPGNGDCEEVGGARFYSAVVFELDLGVIVGSGCNGGTQDPFGSNVYGYDSGRALFSSGINGFEYITIIKLTPSVLINDTRDDKYFHFMEAALNIADGDSLPSVKDMLIDAVITYNGNDPVSAHSLNIYYSTVKGDGIYTIQLADDQLEFELSIAWTARGCVDNIMPNCSQLDPLGQIVIKRTYVDTVIEERIDNLNFRIISDPLKPIYQWQTKAIYWGELGNVNFPSMLELSVPDRYSYGDVTTVED